MRTIAVIARKGGSGKTTVSVHLALAAHLRGLHTVLADTDPQQSSREALKGRRDAGPDVRQSAGPQLVSLQMETQRAGVDALIIDTPAGHEEDIGAAVVLSDLSLLVVRPTFLDIAASLQTATILRRLRRPAMVVLNQAPPPRDGVEPPAVKKAMEALKLMQLPVVPAVLRSRAVYQTALESGHSAEELGAGGPAAEEVAALWAFVERFAFARRARLERGEAQAHS